MKHLLPAAVAAVAVALAGGIAGCSAGSSPASTAAPAGSSGSASSGRRRCVVTELAFLHRAGGLAAVREPEGPARLLPPGRQEDHAGAVPGARHRPAGQAPGHPAGQPGRAGRLRPQPGRVRGRRPGPECRGRVRHRRLRHPGGRVLGAVDALRPVVLRHGPAQLHPGHGRRRADHGEPGEGLRRGLREEVRLAAAVHDHRGHRQGHGLDPGGHGAAEAQLLRLLLRDLHRAGVRHAVPAPRGPHGAGQHRRPGRGVVGRQP